MALEILDGEILNDDERAVLAEAFPQFLHCGCAVGACDCDEPPVCGDCDGAGEVALSSDSDDARPCPTCDGSGIGCYSLGGAR